MRGLALGVLGALSLGRRFYMPKTKKGEKILKAMKKEYGATQGAKTAVSEGTAQ